MALCCASVNLKYHNLQNRSGKDRYSLKPFAVFFYNAL